MIAVLIANSSTIFHNPAFLYFSKVDLFGGFNILYFPYKENLVRCIVNSYHRVVPQVMASNLAIVLFGQVKKP
jgi:hypothetical protein